MEQRASSNEPEIRSTPISGMENGICRAGIAAGLASAAIKTRWRENYSLLLRQLVFSREIPQLNPKRGKHHQKLLDTRDGQAILEIIWKESLDDEILRAIRAIRLFPSGPTAHGLAVVLSEDRPGDVAKNTSAVRNISIAAAEYGLVTRETHSAKRVVLLPAPLLHQFMTTLGSQDFRALQDILPNMPELIAQPTSQRIDHNVEGLKR